MINRNIRYCIPLVLLFFLALISCQPLPYYTADIIVQNLVTPNSVGKIHTKYDTQFNGQTYNTDNFRVSSPMQISAFQFKGNGLETLKIEVKADGSLNMGSLDSSKEYSVVSISWYGNETIALSMLGKRLVAFKRVDILDRNNLDINGRPIFGDNTTMIVDTDSIKLGDLELTPNSTTLVSFYMDSYDENNSIEISRDSTDNTLYTLKYPKNDTNDIYIADYLYEKGDDGWMLKTTEPYYMIMALVKYRVKKL